MKKSLSSQNEILKVMQVLHMANIGQQTASSQRPKAPKKIRLLNCKFATNEQIFRYCCLLCHPEAGKNVKVSRHKAGLVASALGVVQFVLTCTTGKSDPYLCRIYLFCPCLDTHINPGSFQYSGCKTYKITVGELFFLTAQ